MSDQYKCYFEAVRYLESLQADQYHVAPVKNPQIFLNRAQFLWELCGKPGNHLNIIHIGGTAGKGSVASLAQQMISASGKKCGLFTSPYVSTSIEKLVIDGWCIDPLQFADLVDEIKPIISKASEQSPYGAPSYFEVFSVLALRYFERMACDWAILEVGLGGRYDATNIIPHPKVVAITGVDYDHTAILGKTLHQIARDKAGIIKPGCQFFSAEKRPALQKIFAEVCREQHVTCNSIESSSDYHQTNNRLAKRVAQACGVSGELLERQNWVVHLPGRFEIMVQHPMVILDGAHNRAKMRALVTDIRTQSYKQLHLIVGIAADKDSESILKVIAPIADHLYLTGFNNPLRESADPKILMQKSRKYLKASASCTVILNPRQALNHVLRHASSDDLIIITGSFFLVGQLRSHWYPEELILEQRTPFPVR